MPVAGVERAGCRFAPQMARADRHEVIRAFSSDLCSAPYTRKERREGYVMHCGRAHVSGEHGNPVPLSRHAGRAGETGISD